MKKEIDVLMFLSGLALVAQGCSGVPNSPNPNLEPTKYQPTLTPFQPETNTPQVADAENLTVTPEDTQTLTPEKIAAKNLEKFKFGEWDFTKLSSVNLPQKSAEAFGFGGPQKYSLNQILPLITKHFSKEQEEIMHNAALDNSPEKGGNPANLITTNNPNIIILASHSMEPTNKAPGEIAWNAGKFEFDQQEYRILGAEIEMEFNDKPGRTLKGKIVDVVTISSILFDYGAGGLIFNADKTIAGANIPSWGQRGDDPTDILKAHLDVMGIFNNVIISNKPGVFYLVIKGCQSEVPGQEYWSGPGNPDSVRNTSQATNVIVEIDLNNQ